MFSLYCDSRLDVTGQLRTKTYIVIRNNKGRLLRFTGLEALCCDYTGDIATIHYDEKKDYCRYVARSLNWITKNRQVARLSDISSEHVISFLDAFRTSPKPGYHDVFRGEETIKACIKAVSHFFCNLSLLDSFSKIIVNDLLEDGWALTGDNEYYNYRKKVFLPKYKKPAICCPKRMLIRDITPPVMEILLQQAAIYDPLLYYGISYQILSGIRPGELLCMRQPTSPLSIVPGVSFQMAGDKIITGTIDLTREFCLRSDAIPTGRIKRERKVVIFPGFLNDFYKIYQQHMAYLSREKRIEADYLPMFISQNGKAMTYATYCHRFQQLIVKHVVPLLLASEDPVLQASGLAFQQSPPAPHALRHFYTCRLVLEGLDVAQIQFYRGDRDPKSAIVYMQNKSLLEKEMKHIHELVITGLRS